MKWYFGKARIWRWEPQVQPADQALSIPAWTQCNMSESCRKGTPVSLSYSEQWCHCQLAERSCLVRLKARFLVVALADMVMLRHNCWFWIIGLVILRNCLCRVNSFRQIYCCWYWTAQKIPILWSINETLFYNKNTFNHTSSKQFGRVCWLLSLTLLVSYPHCILSLPR